MATSADRHLLFGLIALQVGLIDQALLVAAFQAWARDKARHLADHLADRGGLDDDARAAVEAMVALHVKKHDADTEKSLASIPAGHSTRQRLAALGDPELSGAVGRLASVLTKPDGDRPDRTLTMSVGIATGDGQRFRVLRPHARGGLGAVFVALDEELHREVALKQILDHHADDPASRTRFLVEAEITGGLEHPGIVPVYGLGTYAGGRPYYAMRFVRGDSLKDAISRFHADEPLRRDPGQRSLELRKLLRRFLDVCNAVDYAHSRGVLHRDLKPGNVIVGRYGETLVVDWGLAKAVGKADLDPTSGERPLTPSSVSGSAETLPGSALGTPGFMSPEQARGDLASLGPRSDVYSLGATLYSLLTGKAPFKGDVGEVLRRVQAGAFPPPRQVDPTIDKALEAVCLKAMATSPGDRYASCRALAEDVERWAADTPVTAWREPWTRTLLRWLTRHRTGVTGAAAAALAGVIGLVAVLAVQAAANTQLSASLARETKANTALAAANAELTRSRAAVQARYDLAVEAIQTFHTGVSEDFLLKQDQFKGLRDRLLRSAADFYGKLSALLGKETDVASRRALAAARFEVASLTKTVGDLPAALTLHREVLAARRALAGEPGADAETRADVGRSLTRTAIVLSEMGRPAEALPTFRQAETTLAEVVRSSPSAVGVQDDLASCRLELGGCFWRLGRRDDALAAFRLARAQFEARAGIPGATPESRAGLADGIEYSTLAQRGLGQTEGLEAGYRASLAVRRKLIDEFPDRPDYRDSQAKTHNNLASLLRRAGRREGAEQEFRAALALWRALADSYPGASLWRNNLGFLRINLGDLLREMGRTGEAEAEYRAAAAAFRKLADDSPAPAAGRGGPSVAILANLARSHTDLGFLLHETGRTREAEAEYREVLTVLGKLAEVNPEYRDELAKFYNNRSDVLRRLGRAAEARDDGDRAIAIREALILATPGSTTYPRHLAWSLRRRSLARRALGDVAGAAADCRRAQALWDAQRPRSGEEWFEAACCRAALAGLAGREGSGVPAGQASNEADAAMALLRKAVSLGTGNAADFTGDSLEPLRNRDDFRLLMMDLAMPADPFAVAR